MFALHIKEGTIKDGEKVKIKISGDRAGWAEWQISALSVSLSYSRSMILSSKGWLMMNEFISFQLAIFMESRTLFH